MPIYAFECDACGHNFDRLQKLSDADPTDCPECGAAQVRRQLTAPQFRLAGGGWYETDFKKENRRNIAETGEAKSSSEPAKDSASKVEPAADKAVSTTKPDTAKKEKSSDKASGSTKPKATSGDA